MAQLIEFGRIVIAKKDGTDGAVFSVTNEVKIGRDKDSDIRVKIPSVSRNHARVYQDENGNCAIQNISVTNITTVNGEFVKDFVSLKDGDVFCLGDREFTFRNGVSDKKILNDSVNGGLVVRHTPITEGADENQTLDFSKCPAMKAARGLPLTPIQEILNENHTPQTKVQIMKAATPIVPAAAVLPASGVKNANSVPRRKSLRTSASAELPTEASQSSGKSLQELNASTVKQLNENIKAAIIERRKSYSALGSAKSPKSVKVKTPLRKSTVPVASDVVDQAAQTQNLITVVNARRKSIASIAAVIEEVVTVCCTSEVEVEASECGRQTPSKNHTLAHSEGKTPLTSDSATAVQSAPTDAPIVEDEVSAESVGPEPFSPLKQAINARRRSSLPFELFDDSAPLESASTFTGVTIVIPAIKRDHSKQFSTTSISRRVSIGSRPAVARDVASKRKSIAAPTSRNPVKIAEKPINSCIIAELTVDEDVSLICKSKDRQSILSLPSNELKRRQSDVSLPAPLNTPVKHSEKKSVALKQALCVQLAVDAFASELEMQGVPPGIAYAQAIDAYLLNPSAFSPMKPMASKGPRRRDSLLASLEKKAAPTGRSIFAGSHSETELSCDLISSLTDGDMDIIESYASRLQETMSGDADEAYAVALDAYVRGVEHCHKNVKVTEDFNAVTTSVSPETVMEVAPILMETVKCVEEPEPIVESEILGCEIPPLTLVNDELCLGASLRALFDLPEDYEGRGESDNDEALVSRYAQDLLEDACIDAAVAYGIALDTFLADPVAFRHHIGGVKSRLMELRSPVRTPEIDYDFYYQDEYYSPCKSTEKKPMQSVPNSHIFFASPNPITSPIKISPLCENGEDGDDDVALAVNTTAIPLLLASLPASPVKVLEAVEIMDIAVESSVTPGVIEVAVETESEGVAVCPTTPSRACFTSAFSVIKSAKKSPYLNKATPAKTPCDAAVVDKMAVVHSEAMEVVQAPETDSVIVEDETSSVTEAHTSPVQVQEAWLVSAAATLKKSLPPTSAKKSPFKSAKKIKELTPRQSGPRPQFSTALTAVNLFTEAAESVVAEVVIEEVQESVESDLEIMPVAEEITSAIQEEVVFAEKEVETVQEEVVFAEKEGETVQEEVVLAEKEGETVQEEVVLAEKEVETVQEEVVLAEKEGETVQEEVETLSEVVAECDQQDVPQQVIVVESASVADIPSTISDIITESSIQGPIAESLPIEVEVKILPAVEIKSADSTPLPVTRKRGKNSAVKSTAKKAVCSELSLPAVEELEVIVEEAPVAIIEQVVEVEIVPNDIPAEQVQVEVRVIATAPTPRRTTRQKNATPIIRAEEVCIKVTRSSKKVATSTGAVLSDICSSETENVPENIVAVEIESEVPVVETQVEVAVVQIEIALAEVPVAKGRGKRSNSIVTASAVEIPSTLKRSRRGQPSESDDALEIPVTVPSDLIASAEKNVSECSAVALPTPSRSAGRPARSSKKVVQPVEICEVEVPVPKGRGRGRGKNVLQAIELEDEVEDEEEEEEALALLCDGCDAEHFLDELGLDKIPEGDWFCNDCVEKKSVAPQSAKKVSKVSVKTAAKSTSTPQKKTEKSVVETGVVVSRKRGTEAVLFSPAPEGRRSARLH